MSKTTAPPAEAGAPASSTPNLVTRLAGLTLGVWGFYFTAKLALYWAGLIGFHLWTNLAFAAFILIPVRSALLRRTKLLATVLLAVALLYHDSWLPAIGRVWSQASLLSGFSTTYLLELAGRFISLPVVAMLGAAAGVYWLAARWIRLDAAVIAAMAAVPLIALLQSPEPGAARKYAQFTDEQSDWTAIPAVPDQTSRPDQTGRPQHELSAKTALPELPAQPTQPGQSPPAAQAAQGSTPAEEIAPDGGQPDLDKMMQKFFAQEATRSVSFPAPRAGDLPFDVIFIHVCSLSWDDVKVAGLEHHPLWQRFDILLTRFNSASTYSGPAAIRILRATCGQSAHPALYAGAAGKCYLMDGLKRSGFEPGLALNHDGHFDNFLKIVQAQGQMNIAPFPLNGALITQHAFDDTPIYDDLSVLNRWLDARQKSNSPRVALFYNTISLHDGNHLDGAGAKLNSRENYTIRLAKLLDELEAFMQDIEKSGRRAVVAMIPEHGAALRGDRMQIAGLREIPSPAITLVPVGIKIIGPGLQRSGDTLAIDRPTSYLAVSHIVARLLEKPPYTRNSFAPFDYVADLPITPFVSENEDVVMAGYQGRYYLRQDDSGWVDYTDF